jgi:hypothetical protein
MHPTALTVRIELAASQPPRGRVVLGNAGAEPLRVWRTGSEWGDEALSFELAADRSAVAIVLAPQVYTRNVPSSVEIPAGGEHGIEFDLGDGSWEPTPALPRLAIEGATLTAIYRVAASNEAHKGGVWIGEVRSEPVRVA